MKRFLAAGTALTFLACPAMALSNACPNSPPATPQFISQSVAAGTPLTIIAAGNCAHGCELQDETGGGFYVNYTGQTAASTGTQFVTPYSVWHPPQGSTTSAVSVDPVTAGYIVGSMTP